MDGGSVKPSLAEIYQDMSELLDKQVNAQKEKNFQDLHKLPRAHEKRCAMKMKQTRKNDALIYKKAFNGRKWFISHTRGTGETDRYKMLVNDS